MSRMSDGQSDDLNDENSNGQRERSTQKDRDSPFLNMYATQNWDLDCVISHHIPVNQSQAPFSAISSA